MAQKTARQTRLIDERARALATILLTRRENMTVREVDEDLGLDLIATIHHDDRPGLRQFGVQLKGALASLAADRANAALGPILRRMQARGPFPFPVALFFYTMKNGEAWYTWASEPVVSGEGGFELRSQEEASCLPLDDDAVDEIISRIDAWYDAFYSRTSKRMQKNAN